MTLISCDDYLDIEPKGLVIPETIEDYDLLLNGGSRTLNTTADADPLFLTADDFISNESHLGDLSNPDNIKVKLYKWDSYLFNDEMSYNIWNLPYNNIFTYNVVIESIDNALGALNYKEEDRNVIKAEAKVGRAYEYWLLVNTFGKQYSETSANLDLGVPLVKTADPSGDVPKRSTVKEIYDFIINDVKESIQYLPGTAKNIIRPSKGTAYAMLARFYLSMNNYKEALNYADMAISEKSSISDYNLDLNSSYNSEQFITRLFGYTRGYTSGVLSSEMVNLVEENDIRFKLILNDCKWVRDPVAGWEYICNGMYKNGYKVYNVNHSVSVPEMYLIRAECNARLASGSISEVVTDLNALRIKRFVTDTYVNLKPEEFASKQAVLTFVLEERRREMVMTGTRLFDLKRLNLDPNFAKSVTHQVDGIDYTLAPGANNLVLPIPGQVMSLASELTQNSRD